MIKISFVVALRQQGNSGLADVALERRSAPIVLSRAVRSDHARCVGLRDAALDGGGGERRARTRAPRAEDNIEVRVTAIRAKFFLRTFMCGKESRGVLRDEY